jgi:hypothetical protein
MKRKRLDRALAGSQKPGQKLHRQAKLPKKRLVGSFLTCDKGQHISEGSICRRTTAKPYPGSSCSTKTE